MRADTSNVIPLLLSFKAQKLAQNNPQSFKWPCTPKYRPDRVCKANISLLKCVTSNILLRDSKVTVLVVLA